jgi:hypothetical protein
MEQALQSSIDGYGYESFHVQAVLNTRNNAHNLGRHSYATFQEDADIFSSSTSIELLP